MTEADIVLIREKHAQLDELLPKLEADAWLVYGREGSDRNSLLLSGLEMIGESAYLFTRSGRKVAVVADYDRMAHETPGVFDEVIAYSKTGIKEPLLELFSQLVPETLALNFDPGDPLLDGLTHGLFLRLKEMLGWEDFEGRVVSSRGVLGPLRACKTAEELRRLREAVKLTERILDEVDTFMRVGMSEREVAEFIKVRQKHYGTSGSFSDGAAVLTGRAGLGHRDAGEHPLTPGDTVLIDIGCWYLGYTSDIMRAYYLLREGESEAPVEVQRRFAVGQEAMKKAVAAMKPGVMAYEVDRVAREHLAANGIEPFTHALGHQLGRAVHDGGTTLAPLGGRYGERGNAPLQVGEVYTVEPVVHGKTDEDGVPIGVEQDVVVTESGAEFLSTPQERLVLVGR